MKAVFTIDTKSLKSRQYGELRKPASVRYPLPSKDEQLIAVLKKVLMK